MKENKLNEFFLPKYKEIPDIGLYLDQVAKYINTYIECFPEMTVTPSMISNYAKAKLIDRINKKTYSREQIASLIFIVMAKNVLSINNILTLLTEIRQQETSIESSYEYFHQTLEKILHEAEEPERQNISGVDEKENLLRNIAVALSHKILLERYFEIKKNEEDM